MYNRDLLIEQIKPLIGFESETGYTLPPDLLTTIESRKINHRYPLLNLKNLDLARPDHIDLDDWLASTRIRAIDQAIEDIYVHKRVSENVKTNFQVSNSLFEIHTTLLRTLALAPDQFVGIRVAPFGSDYFRVQVNRLCLSLLNAQEINLYIYHSSDLSQPWKTIPVNVTKSGTPFWFQPETELTLDFFNPELDRGGWYFIGIKTSELEVGNAVLTRKYDSWNKRICGNCNLVDRRYQDSWYGFMRLNSFQAPEEAIEDYTDDSKYTYGINMGFTIQCDLTKMLVDQKQVLAQLAMIKYAEKLMKQMENSTRLNRDAALVQNMAYTELHGEWNTAGRAKSKYGIVDEYEKVLKAVSFEFAELGDRCLPTDKKRGIISWR